MRPVQQNGLDLPNILLESNSHIGKDVMVMAGDRVSANALRLQMARRLGSV